MEDKLHNFFSENDFDVKEPHIGHINRFEKKLQNKTHKKSFSWAKLSVAASLLLIIGFAAGNYSQQPKRMLSSVSPKLQEVESYFVSTINTELKEIEKNRNLDTEKIIEFAVNEIENLEDEYSVFVEDLKKNNTTNNATIISAMIKNYQKRLEILENTLQQIDRIKNPQHFDNEITI